MLTTDRTTQLDELLATSIASFDIPEEQYLLAVSRYEHLAGWLSEYWHGSPIDGIIYPQGAFRLGTVTQPVDPKGEYDVDLVCRRDLAKESTSQVALKGDVGEGLRQYVASGVNGNPKRTEGKRCWTLDYPYEPFHMDILPAIPDSEGVANAILLTDKELRFWQHSNPIDYADWFHMQMREEFGARRAAYAVFKRMDVADVPDWTVKTTLQQSVQALKRHRDLFFSEPQDRPASVIVTTLAAMAYSPGGMVYEVLVDVTGKMPSLVERRDGVYWVANPVQPKENFADRWRSHPQRAERFFEWIEQAHADFSGYGREPGVDRVLQKIAKSFGTGAADRAGEAQARPVVQARQAGLLGASSAGLLGAASHRPAPQHTFHGDATGPRRP